MQSKRKKEGEIYEKENRSISKNKSSCISMPVYVEEQEMHVYRYIGRQVCTYEKAPL